MGGFRAFAGTVLGRQEQRRAESGHSEGLDKSRGSSVSGHSLPPPRDAATRRRTLVELDLRE